MGFFDFIGKAVNVVKGIIHNDSPLIKGLGSVASMVAHAIPGVGPVIDVTVPALDAIFSDSSSPSQQSPTPVDPLSQPFMVNLKRTEGQINQVLDSVKQMQSTLAGSIHSAAEEIKDKIEELMTYHRHMHYHDLHTEVLSRVSAYFTQKKDTFKYLTASSTPNAFQEVLDNRPFSLPEQRGKLRDAVFKIQAFLADPTFYPSQDMLDLYIMALHWLLMFDKAVVVTTGLQAKALKANTEYKAYLLATRSLKGKISDLHADATSARETLIQLIKRLEDSCETRVDIVTTVLNPTTHENKVAIRDSWPEVSIGWIPRQKLKDVIKLELETPFTGNADPAQQDASEKAAIAALKDTTQHLFFEEILKKNMDLCLRPARAVVESLEDSIRHWNSRIPVAPMGGKQHVVAEIKLKTEDPGLTENPKYETDPDYVGKQLRYAITYSNSFGESPETDLTPSVKITKQVDYVELKLHPVEFENDPTAGMGPVVNEDGKETKQDRGIRRKIYVQYKLDANTVAMNLLGDIGETEETFKHNLMVPGAKSAPKITSLLLGIKLQFLIIFGLFYFRRRKFQLKPPIEDNLPVGSLRSIAGGTYAERKDTRCMRQDYYLRMGSKNVMMGLSKCVLLKPHAEVEHLNQRAQPQQGRAVVTSGGDTENLNTVYEFIVVIYLISPSI
ncbi:hypothetical protein C8R44DRAFT_731906 [Mycena epipterygia]|nr:hypothetical protein C8R44DRAFT_731906 [Mycena epipterygia]